MPQPSRWLERELARERARVAFYAAGGPCKIGETASQTGCRPNRDTPFFHATNAEFEDFDDAKIGSTTDSGFLGRGFYFSTDKKVGGTAFKRTMERKLHIEKPLELSYPKWGADKNKLVRDALGLPKEATPAEVTAAAKSLGYDAVFLSYSPVGYHHTEAVVFDTKTIKRSEESK